MGRRHAHRFSKQSVLVVHAHMGVTIGFSAIDSIRLSMSAVYLPAGSSILRAPMSSKLRNSRFQLKLRGVTYITEKSMEPGGNRIVPS
jgi:hypothetical protein